MGVLRYVLSLMKSTALAGLKLLAAGKLVQGVAVGLLVPLRWEGGADVLESADVLAATFAHGHGKPDALDVHEADCPRPNWVEPEMLDSMLALHPELAVRGRVLVQHSCYPPFLPAWALDEQKCQVSAKAAPIPPHPTSPTPPKAHRARSYL